MAAKYHHRIFSVSAITIWTSSFLIGIMASIPRFLTLGLQPGDLALDGFVAMSFSLFVWYINIYLFPSYSISAAFPVKFISKNLGISLLLGFLAMALLTMIYNIFPVNFNFLTLLIMWEFRGLIINLTISLFLFLFYQAHLNKMFSIELEKIRADKIATQFELLRQQVNPHFLFNSLNTLNSMIEMQDKKASRFVLMLSDFYRSALEKTKQEKVLIDEELKVLQAYTFLLEMRFEEALTIEIDVTERHRRSLIPPFTLQLLMENCVKHNVVSLEKPLKVKLYSRDEYIIFENNLQPKRNSEPSTGIGLSNIADRYLTLLHASIDVVKEENYFRVKLPVIFDDNNLLN